MADYPLTKLDKALDRRGHSTEEKPSWRERLARHDSVPASKAVLAPEVIKGFSGSWAAAFDLTGSVRDEQLAGHPALGPTVLYQAPMSPGCVDWRFRGLKPALQPAAPHHWYFDLRIPAPADRPPSIDRPKVAQVHTSVEPGRVHVGAVGGPCDGPPLQVRIR